MPSLSEITPKLDEILAARGRKLGFARHRYRELFGIWPAGGRLKALERTYYPPAAVEDEDVSLPAAADDGDLPGRTGGHGILCDSQRFAREGLGHHQHELSGGQ